MADALPEPPWRRVRPRARRKPLTREAIVEAALRLLDREGLDAVSMRGVSEELGTGAASLYWHVTDKEELLDLVFDRIIGELELPKTRRGRTWQDQVKAFAREMRRVLKDHRDVARITLARIPTGPNALTVSDWLLGVLRAAGLPPRVIALGVDAFFLYLNAFSFEEAVPFRAAGTTDPEEGFRLLEEYLTSLPPERFPNYAALARDMTAGDFDERFEFGLDLLVRGLEAQTAR